MMKKISIALITGVLLVSLLALTACGDKKDDKEKTEKLSGEVKISTDENNTKKVLDEMGKDYKVSSYENKEELKQKILSNEIDMAIVDLPLANQLHSETNGQIVLISPTESVDIKLLYNSEPLENKSPAYLSNRTIVVEGENSTEELVTEKLIKEDSGYNFNFERVESQEKLKEALNNYGTYALVKEPEASQIMKENGNIKELFNLNDLWSVKEEGSIPTEVMIASKKFVDSRNEDVNIVKSDYEKALAKLPEAEKEGLIFYGKSNRGVSLLKQFNNSISASKPKGEGFILPPDEIYYQGS